MRRYFACIKTPEFKKMKERLSDDGAHQSDNSFVIYTYTATVFTTNGYRTFCNGGNNQPFPIFTVGHFYVTDDTEHDGALEFYDDNGYRHTIEEDDLPCFKEFKYEYDDRLQKISKKLEAMGCSLLVTPHTFLMDFNTITWDVSIMGRWPLFARVYSTDMINGYLECWKQIRRKTGVCRIIKECLHGDYAMIRPNRYGFDDIYFSAPGY